MFVEFVSGDIFLNEFDCQALSHGCNVEGKMGAGIAREFKQRYSLMYGQYKWLCQNGQFNPGDVFPWFEKNKPAVLNFATQVRPGADAKLEHISKCFENVLYNFRDWNIKKLAMPRIGAGLGGLDWADVRALIEQAFDLSDLKIVVYEFYSSK